MRGTERERECVKTKGEMKKGTKSNIQIKIEIRVIIRILKYSNKVWCVVIGSRDHSTYLL